MADNTDEVPLENPINNQSENSSDETTLTTEIETIKPIQETENMEVHHHAHDPAAPHHKKNWKSYFWEFLMLFLAVFCGFLAEWQLEHVIEHSREKEFINSMIEDAQIDTANISKVIKENKSKLIYVDSLATSCYNYDSKKNNDYDIYRFYREILSADNVLKPTERTLLQLKNSGGMRLIRNKTSNNSIIIYDGVERDVLKQRERVDKAVDDFVNASNELFNFKHYNTSAYQGVSEKAILLNHDNLKLIAFANRISSYGATLSQYNFQLKTMNENALKLMNTLRKEYHLTDK